MTGPFETKKINIRPPEAIKRMGGKKIKDSNTLPTWNIAGGQWDEMTKENPFSVPIYSKGGVLLLDSFYTHHLKGYEDKNPGFAEVGRLAVYSLRRGRLTPDRFISSSEQPQVRGVITNIAGDKITVESERIPGVEHSGKQAFTLESDATFHHLGQESSRGEVLRKGNLIMVYPSRPQTIIVNGGS